MQFLKQLLNGTKDFFTNNCVRRVSVPRYKSLSLRKVLNDHEDSPDVLKYLPDGLEVEEPPIDREFVFTIVNTLDNSYFPRELRRIEREK